MSASNLMTKNEALKILGILEENVSNDTVQKEAFLKMLRRYPPEQFPEKAEKIRLAFELLQQKEEYWNEFFRYSSKLTNDLSFLAPYLAPLEKTQEESTSQELKSLGNYFLSKKLSLEEETAMFGHDEDDYDDEIRF